MYKWVISFVKKIFIKILGFEPNVGEVAFLKDLSFTMLATFSVAFFMMIIQILGGRILGPSEYGKYSLIETVANILFPLSIFGISTGVIFYMSKEKKQKEFYTAGLIAVLINIFLVFSIFYLTVNFWANHLKIEKNILILGLFFLIVITLKNFGNSFLRATRKIKTMALVEIISGIAALALFFILFILKSKNLFLIFYPKIIYFSLAFFISLLISIPFIKKTKIGHIKEIYSYSHFIFWALLGGTFIVFADRFFINYFLGTYSVGLYQAYYFSAQAIIMQALQAFNLIFFPAMVQTQSKKLVIQKINSLLYKNLHLIFVFNFLSTLFFLWLFGKEYKVDYYWIFLLAIQMTFYILYNIYANITISFDKEGARKYGEALMISAFLFSFLGFVFIKNLGIAGAIITKAFVYLLLAFFYKKYVDYRIKEI